MKASTPELLKFQKLMRTLKESKRGTVGLLECMWMAVARNCPQGDIGRFTNVEIAIMVNWDGDPDEMVNALIDCGWLDRCKVNRLVVHDWHDHCPTYIRGGLARKEKQIVSAVTSEVQPIAISSEVQPKMQSEEPIGTTSEMPSTYSILSSSIQSNPILSLSKPNQKAPKPLAGQRESSRIFKNQQGEEIQEHQAFNDLWSAYNPKGRIKRDLCRKLFRDNVTPEDYAQVMTAARYVGPVNGFVLYLEKFLDEKRWTDSPESLGACPFSIMKESF